MSEDEDFVYDYVSLANGTFMFKENISANDKQDKILLDDKDASLSYMRICSSSHYFDPVTSLCKPCESNYVTTYLMSNYCVNVKLIRDNAFVKDDSYLSNLAIQ